MKRKFLILSIMTIVIIVVTVSLFYYVVLPIEEKSKSWYTFDFIYAKKGSYDTTVFSIHNSWRINWHVINRLGSFEVPGTFGIGVMTKYSMEWHAIAVQEDTRPINEGTLNVNESGIFYLRVIANDWVEWELEVQEYR